MSFPAFLSGLFKSGRVQVAQPHHPPSSADPRRVPLWWDVGALADLEAWLDVRYAQGAHRDYPFLCSLQGLHSASR